MRLSMDKNDRAYDPARRIYSEVWLDGRRLECCVTADEELGEAVIYRRRLDGTFLHTQDGFELETVHGRVEIRAAS